MENLCHTLTGLALARAGLGRLSPLATTACVVAANLPDADVVSLLWGDLMYLEHHRGVTHAVTGLAAQAILLPLALWGGHRAFARARPPAERARFGGLSVASAAGLASHFVLDWTNSYGVRPWLPFDRTWYYGDLVYVVDPWLWLILGGALFLAAERTATRLGAWGVLFAAEAAFVVLVGLAGLGDTVGNAVWVWLAALGVLVTLRFLCKRADPARAARAALAVYGCYLLLLFGAHAAADPPEADEGSPGVVAVGRRPLRQDALPLPMRPDRWRVFSVSDGGIAWSDRDLLSDAWVGERVGPLPTNLSAPEVRAALATCPGAIARHFGRYLRAEVRPSPAGVVVDFVDERFPAARGRRAVGYIPVELGPDLTPKPDPRPCPGL